MRRAQRRCCRPSRQSGWRSCRRSGQLSWTDLELHRYRGISFDSRGDCGDRLRLHLDRMARTLLEAHRTARAKVVLVAIKAAFAELRDRLLGTRRVAVVALEAVSA